MLVPKGILIDIRPIMDRWPFEVVSGSSLKETGRAEDFQEQIDADAASNHALQEAEARGWFRREQEEFFPFFYSWDTPSEMEEFIDEEWSDFLGLDEEAKKATRSAWAVGEADSRVRVRVKMLITRWRVKGADRK